MKRERRDVGVQFVCRSNKKAREFQMMGKYEEAPTFLCAQLSIIPHPASAHAQGTTTQEHVVRALSFLSFRDVSPLPEMRKRDQIDGECATRYPLNPVIEYCQAVTPSRVEKDERGR